MSPRKMAILAATLNRIIQTTIFILYLSNFNKIVLFKIIYRLILKGCYEKINEIFTSYRLILLTITIGIDFVLVIGIIFGFYLCKRINDLEDYV